MKHPLMECAESSKMPKAPSYAERLDSPGVILLCGLLAGLFTILAPLEQALLAAAMPAGTLWCLQDRQKQATSWSATAMYSLAVFSVLLALWRWKLGPWLLAVFGLVSVALKATRLPRLLPFDEFIPWTAAIALELGAFFGGKEARMAAGLAIGVVTDGPLIWSGLCLVLSSLALVGWSIWVQADHGPIQDVLGPELSPLLTPVFALVNACGEELEFRMLIFGGLLSQEAHFPMCWQVLSVGLHSLLFAALHVSSGFPSGAAGGSLVFIWSVFLGILRLWTGGMMLVILLHFQADVVIFILILSEQRRRGSTDSSSSDI